MNLAELDELQGPLKAAVLEDVDSDTMKGCCSTPPHTPTFVMSCNRGGDGLLWAMQFATCNASCYVISDLNNIQ